MAFIDYQDFADTDVDAESRFLAAKQTDPFPEIAPALLNSADISDYVRMTGMLYPFQQKAVKSASYEAAIFGRCIWWNANGVRQEKSLNEIGKDQFILRANSIAFVQVEPFFRLPDYMALRFNLKITHVHRGILLGTGPLVDPGFVGRLLIPLHNLTTNEYIFTCGDGLIWIEFTKTTLLPTMGRSSPNALGLTKRGAYVDFPPEKNNKDPEYYFFKASQHNPIRSSIPEAVRESQAQATEAAKSAKQAKHTVFTVMGIGGAVFIMTLAGLTYTTWNLIQQTWKIGADAQQQLRQEVEMVDRFSQDTKELKTKLQSIQDWISSKFPAKNPPPASHPSPPPKSLGPDKAK